ncbi:MAG: hypothetical protein JWO36_4722, partial [Myxococcales bacterium]|nr:hypothetical protein [Myxococcales bacterium]
LIQLDRSLDAFDNLQLALKYGAAPLEAAVYNEALAYQKLLANQIGDITVRCDQAGVKLSLDGQPLADCPGVEQRRVTPGRHQIVGVKQGFLTKTSEVFVVGGKHQEVAVSLAPVGQSAVIVRRWPSWIPWVVFGAGLTMTGVGGLIELQASQDLAAYDRELASGCPNVGCDANHPVPASIAHLKTRGERENAIAGVAVAAGASAAITGAVLLYLNRGRTIYPKETSGPSLGRIDVVPHAGGASITLAGQF